MSTLSDLDIAQLLAPYLPQAPMGLCRKLSVYLDVLVKWNAFTNLTAIRDPGEIVQRHFGESLFAARHLDRKTLTLLDFGSGAGFPGLPMALLRPDIAVTLAESQNKKSAFLREAVRSLELSTEIWPNRVENMPLMRKFDTIALRAVDHMDEAIGAALPRAASGILLLAGSAPELPAEFESPTTIPVPNTRSSVLVLARRIS
ncbi:MAG: 16S rRNA (guanine(527)-N(7))-methyltransferase RsmG [Acidobacteriota bacterium]|nr:16S rRNA (guanine(527)-N(7))-methyltransferase RsmG [Acidobacteriota bacterium]